MTHEDEFTNFNLKVKYKAGTSIIKVKPMFTYDSKFIIVACGSDIKVYSIQSGECVHTLRCHLRSQIISLQENLYNPLQFYSCTEDGTVAQWDYVKGKVLQVINLQKDMKCFFAPRDDKTFFCVLKTGEFFMVDILKRQTDKVHYVGQILNKVYHRDQSIAFGNKGSIVVSIYKNSLKVIDLDLKQSAEHFTDYSQTCVAVHGSDNIVATGDSIGEIFVWSDVFSKNPIRSKYHWHTLPVSGIAFSTEGSYLYSGGGEAVLIKWDLMHNEKTYLPRLGAPICNLSISKQNDLIVTSHTDNSLQVINSRRIVVQVIQGLTHGRFEGSKTHDILSTGLLYDSVRKALVLNGRPGHLQFYDIKEDKQLFNLDISGRNYVSQNRSDEEKIYNIDVHRAAIDDSGHWLATVEYWNDGKMNPQIWLKFWEFCLSTQTFVLNTNVFLPHNKEVNCVTFQPQAASGSSLFVSTGEDSSFKIWKLQEDSDFSDMTSWTCESMGYYRDFPAGSASFSEDCSLLAVAFDKTATLWTVDVTHLKAALFHEKNRDKIKQLSFGRKSCSHMLLSHDGHSITSWNVLSLSISWIIHNPLQLMVADLYSNMFAAFCRDNSLILFRPDNPEPVFYLENVSRKQIVSAIFVPSKNTMPLTKNSQLVFIDEEMILQILSDENEEDQQVEKVSINQTLPLTPFAVLQAESKFSGVPRIDPQPLTIFPSEKDGDFDLSCPTLVDPVALCSKVLKSLLVTAKKRDS